MQNTVSALLFDVFGTVVDWRSSINREIELLGGKNGFTIDWNQFSNDWRAGYKPAMDRVRRGELPWMNIDGLHRLILDQLLVKYKLTHISEGDKKHLNKAWHRLAPWDDSVEGLTKLKQKYVIGTLSNGNISLLVNMAKSAKLPWDCILSAELFGCYKPDRRTYEGGAELLGLPKDRVMLVAAHKDDLDSAMKYGLKTAFIPRPHEYSEKTDITFEKKYDFNANSFLDLFDQLTNS